MAKKKPGENVYDESDITNDDDVEYAEDSEDVELEMNTGERDVDVYTEEGLEEELEQDELSPWEQGFMEGELEGGRLGECETCGKLITEDMEDTHERETEGKRKFFCSKRCLDRAED